MLMSLYSPSARIPHISSTFVKKLMDSASTTLRLLEHYCAQNRVILHWAHLQQAFSASVVLIYCYCESIVRPELVTYTEDQIKARKAEVEALLGRFSKWPQCARYQALLQTLWQEALALVGLEESAIDQFNGAGVDGTHPASSDGALYAFLSSVLQTNGIAPPIIEDPMALPDYLEWGSLGGWENGTDMSWLNSE